MWILIPFAAVAVAILLHGIVMRLRLRMDAVRRFLLVGIPIGVAIVAHAATNGFSVHALATIALYAFLCELYMFCFTLVIGSISVATLVALRESEVDESVFLHRADTTAMVQVRLARLVKTGFVMRTGDRYSLTRRGLRVHEVFTALRRFFRHDTT